MSQAQYVRAQARQSQSAQPAQARQSNVARPQASRPSAANASPSAQANARSQQAAPSETKAYDLITSGVGYLNRIRWVPVRKGEPYLCAQVNAMMGLSDDVSYLTYDCNVVGKIAHEVVLMLEEDVFNEAKVIVGFRIGDAKPEAYEFPDKTTGEPVHRLGMKGRLLQITFAKVNGERIDIPLVERASQHGAGDTAGSDSDDAPRADTDRDSDASGSACEDASSYALPQSETSPA